MKRAAQGKKAAAPAPAPAPPPAKKRDEEDEEDEEESGSPYDSGAEEEFDDDDDDEVDDDDDDEGDDDSGEDVEFSEEEIDREGSESGDDDSASDGEVDDTEGAGVIGAGAAQALGGSRRGRGGGGEAAHGEDEAGAAGASADPGSDSSEDEREDRNTIGNVPLEWYRDEPHSAWSHQPPPPDQLPSLPPSAHPPPALHQPFSPVKPALSEPAEPAEQPHARAGPPRLRSRLTLIPHPLPLLPSSPRSRLRPGRAEDREEGRPGRRPRPVPRARGQLQGARADPPALRLCPPRHRRRRHCSEAHPAGPLARARAPAGVAQDLRRVQRRDVHAHAGGGGDDPPHPGGPVPGGFGAPSAPRRRLASPPWANSPAAPRLLCQPR